MNIYQSLFDLVNQYIFNNSVVIGSHQELVCTVVATAGAVFLIALPFAIVWKVIRQITGG